jgi:hypothetical protein
MLHMILGSIVPVFFVMAPIIGMVLSLCDADLPPLLATSLTLIGVGSGGVALFLTGLILSSQPFTPNGNVVSGTLLKNVVHPLLAAPPVIGGEAIMLTAVGFLRHLVRPSLRGRLARCRFDADCVIAPERRHASGRYAVDRGHTVERRTIHVVSSAVSVRRLRAERTLDFLGGVEMNAAIRFDGQADGWSRRRTEKAARLARLAPWTRGQVLETAAIAEGA